MAYDLILFDLDDTLVDFGKAARSALQTVLAGAGVPCTSGIQARYRVINEDLWRRFETGELTKDQVFDTRWRTLFGELGMDRVCRAGEGEGRRWNELFLDHLVEKTELLPGALSVVEQAARRGKIAGVTNGDAKTQRRRLARTGLADLLSVCIVSDEVGKGKPHPEIFEVALRAAGVPRDARVLMIGDNLDADIGGALAMGFDACWVSGGRTYTSGHVPTMTVSSVAELDSSTSWLRGL